MKLSPSTRAQLSVYASFVIAILLAVMPLPSWATDFRPDWVGLVLIYWCMAAPERVGVGTGWVVGLIMDVMYGSLLGLNAIGKSVAAFLTIKLHLKLRMFPRWQQAVAVMALLLLNQLLVLWVRGMLGKAPASISYWTPSVVGMVIWPWLFVILRDVRRRFKVA